MRTPASEYFWVTPSSPWNEDYTASIDAHGLHSSQKLTIRSIDGKAQLATTVTVANNKKSLLSCQNTTGQPMATNQACAATLKLQPDALSKIGVDNYQTADGSVTVLHTKGLPSPSELDEQSDDRHLTEYQKQVLRPVVAMYPGTRVTIFFAGGSRSKDYANAFRELLHENHWTTTAPEMVPLGNERIIDAQMSVSVDYLQIRGMAEKVKELLAAFDKAGIKHAHHFALDPDVKDGDVVLWIGPKSPKNVSPDQCAVPQPKQKPGEPHTCEVIRQTTGVCPFVHR
jgi:hypothetical protein